MSRITQSDLMLAKFHIHGNVLTTADFATDPKLACEYRRIICDLDKKGYVIQRSKLKDNLWQYTLITEDQTGQMRMAI